MAEVEDGLRAINVVRFAKISAALKPRELGAAPQLQWLKIAALVVDLVYQRGLGKTGEKNVQRIAEDFDWSKFAPVIVAPVVGGRYAIVDGQHRTTAAALRGIAEVPCQVIVADRKRQAAAFAAINSNITEMSAMQVHAAKVAAGDEEALRLKAVCDEAGVVCLRYPVQAKNQKVGETMAVGMLSKMLAKFGEDVLVTALSCVTRTRDGYPGMLRSQLVTALCYVFEAEPAWRESRKLLKAIADLDLAEAFREGCRKATAGSGGGITGAIVSIVVAHLEERLGDAASETEVA